MTSTYTFASLHNLRPHPKIVSIVIRAQANYEFENYSFLTNDALVIMQKNTPLHVVKAPENQLLFFSNWELINEFQRRKITKIYTVVHKEEPDEILLWALQSELSKAIFTRGDIEKRQQYFYNLLDDNEASWNKIFTAPRPRTAVSALQKLCNLTRGYARKFSKKNQLSDEQANPLARLLQDFKKKDPDND